MLVTAAALLDQGAAERQVAVQPLWGLLGQVGRAVVVVRHLIQHLVAVAVLVVCLLALV